MALFRHFDEDPRNRAGFRQRLLRARAALAFEGLWPALWPSVAVAGLFLAVSLFGLWRFVPAWLHLLGLLGFLGLFALSLWRMRACFAWPARDAGLARLERASGLRHQPLRAIGDREAFGGRDAGSRTLWSLHQERLRKSLQRLRVGRPRSDLPRRDPWALRAGLLLVLVVALVDAGGQAGQRLTDAFLPGLASHAGAPPEVTLWITPPDYTRRPPVFLDGREPVAAGLTPDGAVRVPAGSEALVQVHHLPTRARDLLVEHGTTGRPLQRVGEASAEARLSVDEPGRLAVTANGRELGGWALEVVPDLPPEIRFDGTPTRTHRGVLRTAFLAEDDYGITEIGLRIARPGADGEGERRRLLRLGHAPVEVEDSAYLDLTPHPYAGLPVVLTLEAEDAIGQIGRSEPLEIVLPERIFQHPLARAIIEQRKRLVAEPHKREEVAAMLSGLAQTGIAEQSGVAVQLALRVASTRLFLHRDESAEREVVDLLWDTAVFLEDGSLSVAERSLREIQQELLRALAEGAPDAELERLMAELQQALDAYLDALMQQALEGYDPSQAEAMTVPPDATMFERRDLQELLERARELMQMGAHDQAREMLARLQEMLENLQTGMMSPMMQQGNQALSDLQDLIRRQQGLLEQSFRMQQQMERERMGQPQRGEGEQGEGMPMQGDQLGQQMGQAAMGQDSLRRALGDLMQQLGEMGMRIPRAFGEAELSMRGARDSLGEGAPGPAADSQAQAIDLLQQGGQAMMEAMQEQFGPGFAVGQGQPQPMPGSMGRDPLGRSMYNNGGADLFGTHVPDQLDLGRARQILEELYRRSSERNRPAEELDYLERLLRRF